MLLRTKNGPRHGDNAADIPSNLKTLLHNAPKKGCYWRLSGPQIPMPTKIQQRYW